MRKFYKDLFAALMALIFIVMLLLISAVPANATSYWLQKTARFSATAGEALSIGDPVAIKASDGKAYKAMADQSTLRPCVGVIGKGGASGAVVEIVVEGILGGQTAASPGYRVFLAASPGGMSASSGGPTNAQVIGFVLPGTAGAAISTKYYIKITLEPNTGAGY